MATQKSGYHLGYHLRLPLKLLKTLIPLGASGYWLPKVVTQNFGLKYRSPRNQATGSRKNVRKDPQNPREKINPSRRIGKHSFSRGKNSFHAKCRCEFPLQNSGSKKLARLKKIGLTAPFKTASPLKKGGQSCLEAYTKVKCIIGPRSFHAKCWPVEAH